MRVVFLPNYGVSLAERLIPASEVSEQISTAGYEASGTSNMKFMMNGALTVGTRDGATIEIAEEVGEENIFLFGLTADEVASSSSWYNPYWHYDHEPETRAAIDLLFSDHISSGEAGLYEPIRQSLLVHGDHYMHLADLRSYAQAQERIGDAVPPGSRGMDCQGNRQCRRQRPVLHRSHDQRVCPGDLGRQTLPGSLTFGARDVSAGLSAPGTRGSSEIPPLFSRIRSPIARARRKINMARESLAETVAPTTGPEVVSQDRDLSWMEFNRRVLHEAQDERTPLLERLKFLAIFSSNLDEFFMKRIELLKGLTENTGAGAEELLRDIRAGCSACSGSRARHSPPW